ncbi:hypothetical protein C5O79_01350 [Burkholderia sp. SRS-25]|nr:hypothetical protein C5O79_01350 [Burkholderia sp. SRS-25]
MLDAFQQLQDRADETKRRTHDLQASEFRPPRPDFAPADSRPASTGLDSARVQRRGDASVIGYGRDKSRSRTGVSIGARKLARPLTPQRSDRLQRTGAPAHFNRAYAATRRRSSAAVAAG